MIFRISRLILRGGEVYKSFRATIKLDNAGDRLATKKLVPVDGTTSPLVLRSERLAREA